MNRILLVTVILLIFFESSAQTNIPKQKARVDSFIKKNIVFPDSSISKQAKKIKAETLSITYEKPLFLKTPPSTFTKFLVIDKPSNDWFNLFSTIFGVLIGFFLTKVSDTIVKKNKIKKTGKRWLAELELLKSPLIRQKEINLEIVEDFEEDKLIMPKPRILSQLECDNFKSLEKAELFQFIEWRSKGNYSIAVKRVNEINNWLVRIKDVHDIIYKVIEQYKSQSSGYFSTFLKNLQELDKSLIEVFDTSEENIWNNTEAQGEIAKLYALHIVPHKQDGNYDAFELRDNFINPLNEILANGGKIGTYKIIQSHAIHCLNDIRGIRAEQEYLTENLQQINDLLDKRLLEMSDAIGAIQD